MYIKQLANIITISRIFLSILMLFTTPFSIVFFGLYLCCGITDILDGFIARKTNTSSKIGAILDSIADIVFLVITLYFIIPILLVEIPVWEIYLIIVIAIIRISAYIVGAIKFHIFVALHTILNKVTGIVLFFVPLLIQVVDNTILIGFSCIVAFISSFEELLCQIDAKYFNPNKKYFFDRYEVKD